MYTYIHVHVHTYIHTYIHTCTYIHTYTVHVHTNIHTYIHTHIYTYIHTHKHTRQAHTYIRHKHTHTRTCTWLLVKTRNIYSSESGANPRHSDELAITPATNVPCPKWSSNVCSSVQSVRSLILRKWGWLRAKPVSKTATYNEVWNINIQVILTL